MNPAFADINPTFAAIGNKPLLCPANRYVFRSRLNCSESTAE